MTAVILAEAVFIYPGIGSLLSGAQGHRDYPVMQGIMLMIIFMSLLFNFIADSVYVILDPRTREEALSLIHISEPTRLLRNSYAAFGLE